MRFVAVMSYGRSGSTLLQALLNSVPGVCIRGENFGSLYWLFRAYSAAKKAIDLYGAVPLPPDNPWFGADAISLEEYSRKLLESFVTTVLRPPPGALITGFKEIRLMSLPCAEIEELLDFIALGMPTATFLFNVRNPDDVSRSSWWAKQDRDDVLARISGMNDVASTIVKRRADSFLADYDLYSRDAGSLAPLFAALELPFNSQTLAMVLAKPLKHGRKAAFEEIVPSGHSQI